MGLFVLIVSKDFVVRVGLVVLEALVVEIGMIALDIALSLLALDTAVLLQASSQVFVETMGLFVFYTAASLPARHQVARLVPVSTDRWGCGAPSDRAR